MSIEVDPRLAKDTAACIAEAKQLWWLVRQAEHVHQDPGDPGAPRDHRDAREGHQRQRDADLLAGAVRRSSTYMAGVEQAAANGHDISQIASVASSFVSRVDTEVDKPACPPGSSTSVSTRLTKNEATDAIWLMSCPFAAPARGRPCTRR